MFIINRTGALLSLSRGHLREGVAVGVVIVESSFVIAGDRLMPLPTSNPRPTTAGTILWHGSSVTVAGAVCDRNREGRVSAGVAVGSETRRLLVFGERYWRRHRGQLVPSDAKPFDRLPLSFRLAYGGTVRVEAGYDRATGLPHPGGSIGYHLNPNGIGFYLSEATAADSPLPNIELPDQTLKTWTDRPEPGGFEACPALVGLRLAGVQSSTVGPSCGPELDTTLRIAHPAPGRMIFPWIDADTPISVTGIGASTLAFCVPRSSTAVRVTGATSRVAERTRWIAIDADRQTVTIVRQFAFRYDPRRPASSVEAYTVREAA